MINRVGLGNTNLHKVLPGSFCFDVIGIPTRGWNFYISFNTYLNTYVMIFIKVFPVSWEFWQAEYLKSYYKWWKCFFKIQAFK